MELVNFPSDFVLFPSEIDTIEILLDEGETSADVIIELGAYTVISAKMYANNDRRIFLYDLQSLMQPYLDKPLPLTIWVGSSCAEDYIVVPCRHFTTEPAADFVGRHFLTTQKGVKRTVPEAKEYLSFFYDYSSVDGGGDYIVDFTSKWLLQSGEVVDVSWGKGRELPQDYGVVTMDWSPSLISAYAPEEGARLISYSITVDQFITQEYIIAPPSMHVSSLYFLNAFGCPDSCHFFGSIERELKPTYSSADFRGQHKNYNIKYYNSWKVYSGNVPEGEQPLYEDLSTATDVWTSSQLQVTITDCEIKEQNELDKLPDFNVTYRTTTDKINWDDKRVRVFDETFDNSFE